MPTPFDYIASISYSKEDILEYEKDYNSWMVNKGLSYFPDTIMYVGEINLIPGLDNRLQYDYLMESIRPRKRFSKWAKKKSDKDIDAISSFYNVNKRRASEILKIIPKDVLKKISEDPEKNK